MRILNKKCFSKRQIKKFERARAELIKQIDSFANGIKFVNEHYVVSKFRFYGTLYDSTEWITTLKLAVNNIDLKNNEIAGKNIEKEDRLSLTLAIAEYFKQINNAVIRPIGDKANPIERLLKAYEKQVINILK